jgi:2-keto-4-pentenoate hydratase
MEYAMNAQAVRRAAALLIEARRTGMLLDALPAECRPQNVDEAHAIQEATVVALGDRVAGWKVGAPLDGKVVRGAILQSRVLASGATIPAAMVPLLGVEAEVAFHFDRSLGPREHAYDYAEVAAAVTAFPAIEIVDSRYRDYRGAPLIERIADFVSNGAFVSGASVRRWRDIDLSKLDARIEGDGEVMTRRTGGHPMGDPLLPAVELVNDLRHTSGVLAGQLMTTGTYTGMNFAKPGQWVRATLEGFGSVEVHLAR